MRCPWLIGVALLLLLAGDAPCQEFPVLHYTMDRGLPSNKVYSTYRDSKGFMWIATDKGIARYNGIKFEIFTTFNGIPDNEIFFFQEDIARRMWMATYNGELCYFKDDTFHTAANTPFLQLPFKTSFIKRIALEADSSLTIVFWKNPRFINLKNEKMTVIDLTGMKPSAGGQDILERVKVSPNRFKLIYPDRYAEVDTSGNILSTRWLNVNVPGQTEPANWNISFGQNQTYLFNDHNLMNREGQTLLPLNDTFLHKNNLYIVYHNSLSYFFGTNNGIVFNGNLRLLRGFQVSCITQDKPGNYWASTLENGVFIFDKYFMNTSLHTNAYHGKVQYAVACNHHVFFIDKLNDLYGLAESKITTLFNFSRYVSGETKIGNSHFYLIDSSANLFYFNDKLGVEIDNLANPPYAPRYLSSASMSPNALRGGIRIGNNLYINADNKVLRTDLTVRDAFGQLRFTTVSDEKDNEKIFGFARAPDKSIWYSTVNNVYKVIDGKGVVQPQFKNIVFKQMGFFGEYLIGYTHANRLFVCKNYNSDSETREITGQNCIWDKFYQLDAWNVLISTNNYYRILSLNSLNVSVLENPLVPLQAEAVCTESGYAYFFKNEAVTSIDITRLLTPPEPPKLYFTLLNTSSKSYHIHREVRIPFSESKNISITFSTLSFNGNNVEFYYSVSKDQDNWQPLSGEEIDLVNPTPGYYTIKVKSRTAGSVFSAPVVFTLYVARPVWASWWFITLCVWAALAGIGLLLRYRLRMILKKRERVYQTEIKFMKSEYKAMNALMNPHFIFNTLNNVQSLVNGNDKVAANEYLRIFADLIRQNMHNISKEMIPLQNEVDLVANYLSLEKLRFEEKLTYHINVEDGLDLTEFVVPPLLIQPLVENSIKHGILPLKTKKGIIILEIYEKENSLYIEVRDNGVGMGQSAKKDKALHESYGLSNIRKRIDQLSILQNKTISFNISEMLGKPDLQTWTVVTIIIPF